MLFHLPFFRPGAFRPVILLMSLVLGAAAALAAEPARRTFDVPAGEANVTLRQFASQAAEQIVFPPEDVRGVTTHAVQGEFTPREALTRMMSGTPLVVL